MALFATWEEGNTPRDALAEALAGAVLLGLVAQAFTGVGLMLVYAPTTQAAWASVHFLTYTQGGGWLLRGLHHFLSHALLVAVGAQVGHTILTRRYAVPAGLEGSTEARRLRFALYGLVLGRALLVAAIAITGHALPWDAQGYWARRVELGIAGMSPGIGPQLQVLLQGGAEMGQLALTRFHALHTVVLPHLLAWATVAELWLTHRGRRWASYFPTQAARDGVAGFLLVGVALALALKVHGAPLEGPADPSADYPARPEWFLLPLFRLRKLFDGPLEFAGVAGVPAVLGLYLLALPRLDGGPRPSLGKRGLALLPALVVGLGAAALATVALRADAHDAEFQKARAKVDARTRAAVALAKEGVPVEGPVAMLRSDPSVRGAELFEQHCASCHVLGSLGDKAKATAPVLDGWGRKAWILAMLHDPDAPERFGPTPFAGMMPSVDTAPKDRKPDDPPYKPTPRDEMEAMAAFLEAQGNEGGDEGGAPSPPAVLAKGEALVKERCTTCHLYGGTGDDSEQGYAPELQRYGSLAWTRAQIGNPATKATYREKALEPDLKKHMPRFDGELSAKDLDLVARYTRATARGVKP